MKSVKICSKLLDPLISEEGKRKIKELKIVNPRMAKEMLSMKNDLNLIYNDLLKFQGFINILKSDKSLYEKRIEFKKQLHQDYSKDKAILDRINYQLSLLKEKEDI